MITSTPSWASKQKLGLGLIVISAMNLLLVGCGSARGLGAGPPTQATVVHTGVLRCFEGQPSPPPEKPATCELSGAAKLGNTVIFANDKPIPGKQYSPIFSIPWNENGMVWQGQPTYFTAPAFATGIKYEGVTATPDGQWVLATTAFDRYSEEKPEYDRYNLLLFWPAAAPDRVEVVAATDKNGIKSSVSLRERFKRALRTKAGGPEYFSVESLAAVPGNKLLFGIRQIGPSYKDAEYTIKLVEAPYTLDSGKLQLAEVFTQVYDFTPPPELGIPHKLGLSGMEYDPTHGWLYLLTSFEESDKPEGIGAYLWVLPLQDLAEKKSPLLVKGSDGQPLVFSHKSEGVAVLGGNKVLVIADDDRIITKVKVEGETGERDRRLNESPLEILELH